MKTVLCGDIGGTNARFVLFKDGVYAADTLNTLPVGKHSDLADTIRDYLALVDCNQIDKIALSVASTAEYGDAMELTNNNVSFRVSDLVTSFGLSQARVVNDFTAAALGVVRLPEENLVTLNEGQLDSIAPRAVIGAGTGLGVSGLVYSGNHWIPLQGQGGHVTMVATTARELAIQSQMAKEFGHVSAERYLSGPGIVSGYDAICESDNQPKGLSSAGEVSAQAIENRCEVCSEVMTLFCKYLGIVTGDLAVTLGSTGGIYIAGGIVPSLGDYFTRSEFLYWLHHKGRFSAFVEQMPVWIVTGGEPALYGAYDSLQSHYDDFGYTAHSC